jgi:prophage antirepressor-like protein
MQSNEKSVPTIVDGEEKSVEKVQIITFKEHQISSVVRNNERYYSATEMAKPYGVKPAHFLRTENTQRFIEKSDYFSQHRCQIF